MCTAMPALANADWRFHLVVVAIESPMTCTDEHVPDPLVAGLVGSAAVGGGVVPPGSFSTWPGWSIVFVVAWFAASNDDIEMPSFRAMHDQQSPPTTVYVAPLDEARGGDADGGLVGGGVVATGRRSTMPGYSAVFKVIALTAAIDVAAMPVRRWMQYQQSPASTV